jgi:large subunit ribosomal protein L24
MANSVKIRRGDMAVVIAGKDKGKKARVLRVMPAEGKVVLEAINMLTKHRKPRNQTTPGGIIKQEGPVHISNVMVICPGCSEATRVGHKVENGEKTRVCKKCGAAL